VKKFLTYLTGDKVIWIIAILLLFLSIISVYSFIPVLVKTEGGSTLRYFFKHTFHVVFGLIIMFGVHFVNPKVFAKMAKIGFYLAIALLLFTIFFGVKVNDAGRWIRVPLIGTFQTSDFAKVAVLAYLAKLLEAKESVLGNFKEGYLKVIWPLLLICALIVKDNFSTAFILFGVGMIVMFIGKAPIKYLLATIGAIVLTGGLAVAIHEFSDADIMPVRYETWKNRIFDKVEEADPINDMQSINAELAIAKGNVLPIDFSSGKLTIGNGQMKHYVAEAYADFYFASFVEEFGLVFAFLLIMAYLIMLFRIFRIGLASDRKFEIYVCLAFGILMLSQTFVNMAVSTGLGPVTGQNIPLLGMGGSSMMMSCLMLGIVLSISRNNKGETSTLTNVIDESDE
jgi:cell division protein FtsW